MIYLLCIPDTLNDLVATLLASNFTVGKILWESFGQPSQ